ncbi:hypothetical protein PsorP6_017937 [Peronosclerospora sorghi]|uniref:Uncharacterized protein n=1 Tax=Peronosclerospora sorghi TaxID=230839 RepID=A0ACC0WEV3_9STRA|nr:hypothetical protein PsorP6_017937 [Peronosclerospora sorghi]
MWCPVWTMPSRSGPTCLPQRADRSCVRSEKSCVASKRDALGKLLSLEMGKFMWIALSHTISGSVLPSERPGPFMMERYNPRMGHIGLVTAFNFPCVVLFWNAALSLVWRFKSPLSRFRYHRWRAPTKIIANVLERNGQYIGIVSSHVICGCVYDLCHPYVATSNFLKRYGY